AYARPSHCRYDDQGACRAEARSDSRFRAGPVHSTLPGFHVRHDRTRRVSLASGWITGTGWRNQMKRYAALAFSVFLSLAGSGCGAGQEPPKQAHPDQWMRDQIHTREQMAEILETANQLKDFENAKLYKEVLPSMIELKKVSEELDHLVTLI